jgi:hypothetical protein
VFLRLAVLLINCCLFNSMIFVSCEIKNGHSTQSHGLINYKKCKKILMRDGRTTCKRYFSNRMIRKQLVDKGVYLAGDSHGDHDAINQLKSN